MGNIQSGFYVAGQVREIEARAIRAGVGGYEMMQRAAAAAFAELARRWPATRSLCVLCGPGNNGGDGFEIARLARAAGWKVQLLEVGQAKRGVAVKARKAWLADGGRCGKWRKGSLARAAVVVDALLGIGLSRKPEGAIHDAICSINAARSKGAAVLAVDLPSGLDADSGHAPGVVVEADVTVTFIARKPGLFTGAGPNRCGEVVAASLDLPVSVFDGVAPAYRELDGETLRLLPRRARGSHKGNHGHVLLIGGDLGMGGAILLAARGALRAGAGLVSVATHPGHAAALTGAQPELMVHGIEPGHSLERLLDPADVVAIGPGLGRGDWGSSMWSKVLGTRRPMVVDADGLNWLADNPESRANWVLTPHPGEAARLLGTSNARVQADRPAAVAALRKKFGGVAVLKGAGTLVQGRERALCAHGSPGMAVCGMGDVLCGITAGFLAQGIEGEEAAGAAVAAHALAGERAAAGGERGMLPSDLLSALRAVLR